MELRLGFLQAHKGGKVTSKSFSPKTIMFEGSWMISYAVRCDWKFKLLQAVIQKYSVASKNLGPEHVPLKTYWRRTWEKCVTGIEIFFIIFRFISKGKGAEAWSFCSLVSAEKGTLKSFWPKSGKSEDSRMLRYGVTCDIKNKSRLAVIEKSSLLSKKWCSEHVPLKSFRRINMVIMY